LRLKWLTLDRRHNAYLNFYQNFPTVEVALDGWSKSTLEEVDEIFISPGIAQNEEIVIWALEQGIDIVVISSYFLGMFRRLLLALLALMVNQLSPNY